MPAILELLAPLGTQGTVALLRHLPESRRRVLVAGLPTGAALASALLLGYTEDTLGAWADPDVVTLPGRHPRGGGTGAAAPGVGSPHAQVFVVDAARQLAGVVAWHTLLQAPAAATLATLDAAPAGGAAGARAAGRRRGASRLGTGQRACRWSSPASASSA